MNDILRLFEDAKISNIIFFILAVLSLILAFYFYLKSKKDKRPLYNITSSQIIRDNLTSIENLKFYFKDKPLNKLSQTKIAIWNAGKETIRSTDLVSSDKLRIETSKDIEIYDYNILMAYDRNNISLILEGNCLYISFTYLDKDDGFIINLFHNGASSSDIIIRGSIIGVRQILKETEKSDRVFENRLTKIIEKWIGKSNNFFRIFVPFVLMIIISFFILGPVYLVIRQWEKYIYKTPKEFRFKDS